MSRVKTARLVELHLALMLDGDASVFTRDEWREYNKRTQSTVGGQANCKRACIAMAHTSMHRFAGIRGKAHRRYMRNTVTHIEHVHMMRHHRNGKVKLYKV